MHSLFTGRVLISANVVLMIALGGCEPARDADETDAPSLVWAARNYPAGRDPWSVAIGDLNGDGQQDLIVGGSQLTVLLNRKGYAFSKISYDADGQWVWRPAVGDLNADGKPDLILPSTSHHVRVMLNQRP